MIFIQITAVTIRPFLLIYLFLFYIMYEVLLLRKMFKKSEIELKRNLNKSTLFSSHSFQNSVFIINLTKPENNAIYENSINLFYKGFTS